MKTLLICHKGSDLDRVVLARWLNATSELVGIIELDEARRRVFTRVKREIRRVGWLRFLDVLAYRLYHKLFLARRDRTWRRHQVAEHADLFPPLPEDLPVLKTESPNTSGAEAFVRERRPDVMIARCKHLLKKDVFEIATHGTYVMHPGVCPEYRNAHGCFWALANDDREKVGMTLLRIDEGVDTGPVYGYYSYDIDEVEETPFMIQNRVVLENLDALAERLREIVDGSAEIIDTSGRRSETWGQPWLSRYLSWKWTARNLADGPGPGDEGDD